MNDQFLSVACLPGLSHGAARLYAILACVSQGSETEGGLFPVTFSGLMRIHPGIGGAPAGYTTILRQVSELRGHGLLETSAALHRNSPDRPVLFQVKPPDAEWRATDGSPLTPDAARRAIGPQVNAA